MQAFRTAVEAWDFEAVGDLLADDVVFRSPVAFKPYAGRPVVHAILRAVGRVFTDFHYVEETRDDAGHSVLRFRTLVGDVELEGADLLTVDDAGKVRELTVMVRPLSAAQALAEAMAAEFPRIQAEASGLTATPEESR